MRERTRIKFCRINSTATLETMASLRVDFAGLHAIESLDSGRLATIRHLVDFISNRRSEVVPVLLTKVRNVQSIVNALNATQITWLQLHSPWEVEGVRALRINAALLNYKPSIVALVDPAHAHDPGYVAAMGAVADYLIVDHRAGGTGTIVSTEDIKLVVDVVGAHRTFLAGGLSHTNVAALIDMFRPYAVDVQSGIADDHKEQDPHKMRLFVEAVASCCHGQGTTQRTT